MDVTPDPKPPKPFRSKERLIFTAMQPCFKCGKSPAGVAHHVRWAESCGWAQKPGDDKTIPLCYLCHDKLHNYQLNMGREEIQDEMDRLDLLWDMKGGEGEWHTGTEGK